MSPPDTETLAAAIDELRREAGQWRDAAGQLRATNDTAAGLVLGRFEASAPADWGGVTDVYRDLRQRLTRMLDESATALDALAATLTTAADPPTRR